MAAVLSLPDGYTIGFGAQQRHQRDPLRQPCFNFIRDSAPVAGTMLLTNVMVVPFRAGPDRRGVHRYAKANPGKVSFASSGTGASPHMSGGFSRR